MAVLVQLVLVPEPLFVSTAKAALSLYAFSGVVWKPLPSPPVSTALLAGLWKLVPPPVGVGVCVAVAVFVGVLVGSGVYVGVLVGVLVGVGEGPAVKVCVGVEVATGVEV